MMQYLINATAIWLLSLLVYDALLRRETYHVYNRFYLLGTLFAGALLPLIPAQYADTTAATPILQSSLQQVARAKTAVSEIPAIHRQDWSQWPVYGYFIGVVTAFCGVLTDALKLARHYRTGKRSVLDGWTMVETGKEHAPFSFRNVLFVNSIASFTSSEWHMLSAHERRHASLFHIADIMLLQVARIVFWFHPLIYIYHRRLLLVHEYQADSFASVKPKEYGSFLVEQALLTAAPSIAHSFNRSPIKNRLLMLTRKSHSIAHVKKLVVLPLIIASALYCSFASYSQSKSKSLTATFANSSNGRTTYKAILADPIVRTIKPSCSVASCTISFLPKGEDFIGPFKCPGGKMHEKLVNYLSTFKGENIRIFIEDIRLNCNGTIDSTEMPLLITAKEKL